MPKPSSVVLTLRVPLALDRRVTEEARRKRRSKSAVLRDALQSAFREGAPPEDPAREARRQSLLVSGRASERDAIAFIERAADRRGWR
jgi:Ribbon-helix-helix protein, copG family/Antitoxin MazE-like